MATTRRKFIKLAGYGAGALALPYSGINVAFGQSATDKIFVVIYLRGGADSMYMVAPGAAAFTGNSIAKDFYMLPDPTRTKNKMGMGRNEFFSEVNGELEYKGIATDPSTGSLSYDASLSSSTPGLILPGKKPGDADTGYMLHPEMAYFHQLFSQKKMSILHGVGGVNSYSHFSAQDASEWARPVGSSIGNTNGWLHDVIGNLPGVPSSAFSGVAMSASAAQVFAGGANASKISSLYTIDNFDLGSDEYEALLAQLYTDPDHPDRAHNDIRAAGKQTVEAMNLLSSSADATPALWDDLSNNRTDSFYQRLRDAARLIKTPGSGVRCINVDTTMKWDTHNTQVETQLSSARRLNLGLEGFMKELAEGEDVSSNVCVLLMSEFGRTLDVNGDNGTDHGRGSTMYVVSSDPAFNGGELMGNNWSWPEDNGAANNGWLHSAGRYYTPVEVDYRAVYENIMTGFMGVTPTNMTAVLGGGFSLPSGMSLFS